MKHDRPHVCVVGSANLDLFFRSPRLPKPGETLLGHSFFTGFGGKGANQAVMAARMGARVTMVGRVGRDVFAEQLLQNFRDQGVDTTHVTQDGERGTGVAAIVVDDAGQNCILVIPGANMVLTPEHVRAAAGVLQSADVLLVQLEVPVETTLEAFRLARAAGVRTVLNPAPARPLPPELLTLTDLCVPNETELEQLTGQAGATLPDLEQAARSLLGQGPGAVLVTLGERGALVVDARESYHAPPTPVQAVDASGAGDAFIGSLAVFLAEGLSLREAVRQANIAAALSVTRPGTQASYPRRDELNSSSVPI
jgi:ribokinase